MIVSELIAELQRLPPYLPVKILIAEISEHDGESGERIYITLSPEDARTAHTVIHEGNYVLIESE